MQVPMSALVALCIFLINCVPVRSEGEAIMRTEAHGTNSEPQGSSVQSTFRQVVRLTRVTFPGNVIKSTYVKNWIVLYCAPWFEPCAELQHVFDELASKVSQERNGQFAVLSSDVRFAQVDCSKEKPLCNDMNTIKAYTYPVVVHYHGNTQSHWVAGYAWTGLGQEKLNLADWVKQTLRSADASDDIQDRSVLTLWRGLDQKTLDLMGGLVCVCVLVFSLTKCMDQFMMMTKLRSDQAKQRHTTDSDSGVAVLQCVTPVAVGAVELIDLDALVPPAPSPATQLPAAPASLEL